ncbi:MAG TPA: hypothetical protein VJ550_08030 [Geomonas sp.]|nr:hypothetical protein [Geomonas sp.]
MKNGTWQLFLLLAGGLLLLSAWSGNGAASETLAPQRSLQAQYSTALNDARNVTPAKIYLGLTPIVTENRNLIWENGVVGSRLLVATIAGSYAAAYICTDPGGCAGNTCKEGGECSYGYDTWVTVAPELRAFFLDSTPSLLRVVQVMGLPPSYAAVGGPREAKYIMELWARPADLFRPCPDSEISDTSCETGYPTDQFRAIDTSNKVRATEGLPAPVFKTYTAWFNNRARNIYTPTAGSDAYPWTRLGYTYDWGCNKDHAEDGSQEVITLFASARNCRDHIGLSEFLLHGAREDGSKIPVGIHSVKTIEEYFAK